MPETFHGFPRQDTLVAIPASFFTDLLPLIDDMAELQLMLFFMWAVQQREGVYRFLTYTDLANAPSLTAALQAARPNNPPQATLDDALARAVGRGALLWGQVPVVDESPQTLYFMNTERGREAQQAIQQGQYTTANAVEILPPRPNIYRLYEQEIGPITPMIADGLKDLETSYPAAWMPEAIRVAAEKQAKHLQFIRAVLERWRKEGKTDDEITRRHGPEEIDGDGRKRFGGKYADWIDQ